MKIKCSKPQPPSESPFASGALNAQLPRQRPIDRYILDLKSSRYPLATLAGFVAPRLLATYTLPFVPLWIGLTDYGEIPSHVSAALLLGFPLSYFGLHFLLLHNQVPEAIRLTREKMRLRENAD